MNARHHNNRGNNNNSNIAKYGKPKHRKIKKVENYAFGYYRIIIALPNITHRNKIQLTLSMDSAEDSCKLAGLWVLI